MQQAREHDRQQAREHDRQQAREPAREHGRQQAQEDPPGGGAEELSASCRPPPLDSSKPSAQRRRRRARDALRIQHPRAGIAISRGSGDVLQHSLRTPRPATGGVGGGGGCIITRAGCGWAAGCELRTAGYRPRAAGCGLRAGAAVAPPRSKGARSESPSSRQAPRWGCRASSQGGCCRHSRGRTASPPPCAPTSNRPPACRNHKATHTVPTSPKLSAGQRSPFDEQGAVTPPRHTTYSTQTLPSACVLYADVMLAGEWHGMPATGRGANLGLSAAWRKQPRRTTA